MRKRTIGCLAVPLSLLLAYGAWVSHPPLRHGKDVQRIVNAVSFRRETRFALAQKPKVNGYLHRGWKSVWGKRSEIDPQTAHSRTLRAWLEWCEQTRGEPVDYRSPETARDPEFRKALGRWEQLLPGLLAELSKPQFSMPLDAAPNEMTPGLTGCRLVAVGVQGYAAFLQASGRTEQAVLTLIPILQWSRKLMAEDRLSSLGAGLQVQQVAVTGISETLGPRYRPDVQQLRRLTRELELNFPPFDVWQAALESELFGAERVFDRLPRTGVVDPELPATVRNVLRLPGIKERERRLYRDELFPYLEHALESSNTLRQGRGSQQSMLQSWLLGRRGVLAVLLIPNLNEVKTEFLLARHRMVAVRTLAAIRLYEQQEGKLPPQLTSLPAIGIAELPGFAWHDDKQFTYRPDARTFVLTVRLPSDVQNDDSTPSSSSGILQRHPDSFVVTYRSK